MPVIHVRDIEVQYDRPKRLGRFRVWLEENGLDEFFKKIDAVDVMFIMGVLVWFGFLIWLIYRR